MRIDALAIRLRPRTALEAADLGVRLCQDAARSVYPCYAMVAIPVAVLALASFEIATWLPGLVIWCAKPWMDRTILFVLSRSAFGQRTRPSDVLRAQREVWWRRFFFTWMIQRLSLWRSLTQPVYQLEALPMKETSARIRQIRKRTAGAGVMVTTVFSICESALTIALLSLVFWLAPPGQRPDLVDMLTGGLPRVLLLVGPMAQALAVLFLEPFYVAAGFAMYLNRRAELEAWDIEQEFRHAFAS